MNPSTVSASAYTDGAMATKSLNICDPVTSFRTPKVYNARRGMEVSFAAELCRGHRR
jgi:hypothetical protein